MLNGHSYTGVTIHSAIKEIDRVKVLNQFLIPIFQHDSLTKLFKLCFDMNFISILYSINIYNNFINHTYQKSYYTYPSIKEGKEFKAKEFKFLKNYSWKSII